MSTDWHTPAETTNLAEVQRADGELDQAITDNMGGGSGDPPNSDHRNVTSDPIVATSPEYPPDAMNDEFDDGSINFTLWDLRDPDSDLTLYEGRYGLVMTRTASTNWWAGLYQALPSGDCTIWVKVGYTRQRRSAPQQSGAGIILSPDASVNACHVFYVDEPGGADFRELATNGDILSPSPLAWNSGLVNPIVIRLRRNGTSWFAESSIDGTVWESDPDWNTTQPHNATDFDSPVYVGIGMFVDKDEVSVDSRAVFRYFRYAPYDVGILHILNDVT